MHVQLEVDEINKNKAGAENQKKMIEIQSKIDGLKVIKRKKII